MFCIDMEKSKPEIMEYTKAILEDDMAYFGVKNAMALDDCDWRVFQTEAAAEKFLAKYNETLEKLKRGEFCKSRDLPCLLYRRRYLVQSAMGLKLNTVRHYKKPWKKGDLFNLHDQTIFLTVRVKSIVETSDGGFKYNFELCR